MNQQIYPKNVEIQHIDFSNFTYSLFPGPESTPEQTLVESITRYGIIHPPVVQETSTGTYAIVTGRKRLEIFRSRYRENAACNCLVYPEQISQLSVFSFLLEEITIRRELTPVEKAVFLQKISSLTGEKEITENFLPRLELPSVPGRIRQQRMLLDLEERLILALHRGELHEKTAWNMTSLTPEDRLTLLTIISSLHLGMNYQGKLLDICRELATRENRSIASLLNDGMVREILENRSANPPQKARNLMTLLLRKYRPRSSRAEADFNRFVASLKLPQDFTVSHTESFEDDAVTLAIKFPDKGSMQSAYQRIRHAVSDTGN